jgi:hypothetical protein
MPAYRAVQAAGIPCSAIPLTDIELRFQQYPKVRELRFQSTYLHELQKLRSSTDLQVIM